jgi:phage baseplate assembly protein W
MLVFWVFAPENFDSQIKALLGFRVYARENFGSQIKALFDAPPNSLLDLKRV